MKKKKIVALQYQNLRRMNKFIKKLPFSMSMLLRNESAEPKKTKDKDEWDERCDAVLAHFKVYNQENAGQYELPSLLNPERGPQHLAFARIRGKDDSMDGTNMQTVLAVLMNEARIAKISETDPEKVERWDNFLIGLMNCLSAVVCL